jgi:hypothetical protein
MIVEFVKWVGITPHEVKDVLGVFVVLFVLLLFNKIAGGFWQ